MRHIAVSSWVDVVYNMTDLQFLSSFRIRKEDLDTVVKAIAWPATKTRTTRNEYSTSPHLSTLILLRRLASPCRWMDVVLLFKKHPSHMSEIFWEGMQHFLRARKHLLYSDLHRAYISAKAELFSGAIQEKCSVLSHCLGFMDGTVLGIARPSDGAEQNAAYNGHKRKHALKFQTITGPDGIIIHAHGPMEGRRHDWALYVESDIERQLREVCLLGGEQYYIHADSGYNRRDVIDVPFQGANICPAARAANESTARARVTVEWCYKEIKLYWTTVDFKRKLRVGESSVGSLYIASMLLHNIRSCIQPNTISQYFCCPPPSVAEYLSHKD